MFGRSLRAWRRHMDIVGLDTLYFESDRLQACAACLVDFGLEEGEAAGGWRSFAAGNGSSIALRPAAAGFAAPTRLCEIVYGVKDVATLEAIAVELARDRAVRRADGVVHALDDAGFAIGFRVTPGRPRARARPRGLRPESLASVLLFVPDLAQAERFYVERLGFEVTDRITGAASFLTPGAGQDHHALCLMRAPGGQAGLDQFTFHLASGADVMRAGSSFERHGYRTSWGPGRHLLGSNWFWYFDSPFGCKIAYDADMARRAECWEVRETAMTPDRPQFPLFSAPDRWAPRALLH
jgi:catechol 2,3-dioxygenase-like lactoylglutathione lyase family enzyme